MQNCKNATSIHSLDFPENGEGIQVLHYEESQKYEAHFDYFHDSENVKNGGQRAATVLMYLTDVEEGGETVFPNSQFITPRTPEQEVSDDEKTTCMAALNRCLKRSWQF